MELGSSTEIDEIIMKFFSSNAAFENILSGLKFFMENIRDLTCSRTQKNYLYNYGRNFKCLKFKILHFLFKH